MSWKTYVLYLFLNACIMILWRFTFSKSF
jgi:hypothetical protein